MSQWSISLSDEPSGGVSAFMHIQADTNLEAQEVGFELDLPENVYAELCVRQYVDTGEEYTNVVAWTTINTSGAQSFMVPINKAYVQAGGPTMLQMTFRTVGNVNLGTGTATQWKNYYTYLSHYVSQTHIATICEEKDNYRFGFNGKEKDNEAKGIGNSLDFGARIYDSRLGRFLSLDPLMANFPAWSPYVFAMDNPIRWIDENGLAPGDPMHHQFLTTVALDIYTAAKAKGASTKGALLIISQAAIESSWGADALKAGDYNLFGTMTLGNDFKRSTSHGRLKDFSQSGGFAGSLNYYFDKNEKRWPGFSDLIKKSDFDDDEIDRAFNTGTYFPTKEEQ